MKMIVCAREDSIPNQSTYIKFKWDFTCAMTTRVSPGLYLMVRGPRFASRARVGSNVDLPSISCCFASLPTGIHFSLKTALLSIHDIERSD